MKKFVVAALLLASVGSFAAGKGFHIVNIEDDSIENLSSLPTDSLCGAAAFAFAMCHSDAYNVANVIISLRDVNDTRACQRGYDQGYILAEKVLADLSEAELEPIKNCSYIMDGE